MRKWWMWQLPSTFFISQHALYVRVQVPGPRIVLNEQAPAPAIRGAVRSKVRDTPRRVHGRSIDVRTATVAGERDIIGDVDGAQKLGRRVPARKGAPVEVGLVRFRSEPQPGREAPVLDQVEGAPTETNKFMCACAG